MTEREIFERYEAQWGERWGFHVVHHVNGEDVLKVAFYGNGGGWLTGNPSSVSFFKNGNIREEIYTTVDGDTHRITGPAVIRYRQNGTIYQELYFILGALTRKNTILHPHKQSIKTILNENNTERQRIKIELYGWINFLKAVKAQPLEVRNNMVEDTVEALFEYTIVGKKNIGWPRLHKLLVCACPSTARVYAIEVPRIVCSCRDAQEWLKGDRLAAVEMIGAS